jgi:hypothetical protein
MSLQNGAPPEIVTEEGFRFLSAQFSKFGPRSLKPSPLPVNMFKTMSE